MRGLRRSARVLARVVISAALLSAPCTAIAGSGVAELTLDRSGVAALLSASLPRSETVSLAGLGEVRLTIVAVDELRFLDGEVRAFVTVTFQTVGLDAATVTGKVEVRYAPAVERTTGTARLVALSARPVAPLRLDAELAGWPRRSRPHRSYFRLHAL